MTSEVMQGAATEDVSVENPRNFSAPLLSEIIPLEGHAPTSIGNENDKREVISSDLDDSSSSGSQPSSAPCIEKVWRTIHLASSSEIEELENRFKSRDAKIWKSASSFLPLPEGPKVGTLSAVRFMVPEPRSYFIRSVVTVKNDQGKERKGILFLIYKAKQVTQALTYGVVLFEAGNEELVPLDDDGSTVCSTHPLEVASSDEFLSFSQAKVMPLIPRWIQNLHSKSFSSSDECKILSSKRSRTPRQISDLLARAHPNVDASGAVQSQQQQHASNQSFSRTLQDQKQSYSKPLVVSSHPNQCTLEQPYHQHQPLLIVL